MKFLLIDDHALIREALSSVLRELRSDAVVLEAASCQQGTDLMREHADVSLFLLDLRLPDRDGFDMLAVLRETYPAVGVVMLSAFNDRDNVVKALDQGALGFISKTSSRDVLLGALRLVLAGGVYIPPEILAAPAPSPVGRRAVGKAAGFRTTPVASRPGPHGTAGGRARVDDAWKKQQADLPGTRSGGADRQELCVRDPQSFESQQPHGSRAGRGGIGMETAKSRQVSRSLTQ